jgi:hypothetical protein
MWRRSRRSLSRSGDAHYSPDSSRLTQEIALVRIALENISARLEAVSPREGYIRRSGRIYLILAVIWIMLCIISLLFTINVFTDVQPGGSGGLIEILVSGEGKNTVGLQVNYSASKTEYDLYFPDLKSPVNVALVLFGPAMLSHVNRANMYGFSRYRTGTCRSGTGSNPGSAVSFNCQVFYGTFPSSSGIDVQRDFGNCGPSSRLYPSTLGPSGLDVDASVSGTSGAAAGESILSGSILTKVITLPLLIQPPARIEYGIYPVGNVQDLAAGDISPAVGCDTISVPSGYEISGENPAPVFQDSLRSYWAASGNGGPPSVAIERTWAGAAANVGVTAVGIFFSLAAIFVPLWLQSRRKPRPARRP